MVSPRRGWCYRTNSGVRLICPVPLKRPLRIMTHLIQWAREGML
jgi:hypothetical protein